MSAICISYSRQNKAVVSTLVEDVATLGHGVWLDQQLSGGQAWWERILLQVRECDVFVFALSPESLDSTACKREYQYASELGKPILPVLVAEGVSTNLLPAALSAIQFVDYRIQDRDAALRLARALASAPTPTPLPDPLPPAPEIPISYLSELARQVETTSTLGFEEQSAFVVTLKRSLRKPDDAEDARRLLQSLRRRRDLLASVAEEIDDALDSTPPDSSASGHSGAAAVLTASEEQPPPVTSVSGAPGPAGETRAGVRPKTQSGLQRLAYGVILLASIAMIVFSCVVAYEIGDLPRKDYSRFSRDLSNLHAIVKAVSLTVFLSTFFVFLLGYRGTSAGSRQRYALLLGMLGCLVIAFWSLLLSGGVSFDEVWPAWVIASAFFALLSFKGLRGEKRSP